MVKVPLVFDDMPFGDVVDLVDLGDDYFAVMLYEKDVSEHITIVTFKLLSERGGDGALSRRVVNISTCNAMENECPWNVIYSFKL